MNPKNIEKVAGLRETLTEPEILVFFSFSRISGQDMTDFRKKIRRAGGLVKVARNNFLDLAMDQGSLSRDTAVVDGPTGFITYRGEDETGFLRAIREFQKDRDDRFIVRGGFQRGEPITREEIFEASRVPGRDHARAKLCGTLLAPVSQLLLILQAAPRQLVSVLSQVAQKESGEA